MFKKKLNKVEKYISYSSIVVQGLMFITIGILLLIFDYSILNIVSISIGIIFLVLSFIEFIKVIKSKKNIIANLIKIFFDVIFGIIFITYPYIFKIIFPLIFTIYIALETIIRTIDYVVYYNSKHSSRFVKIIRVILSYVFLIIMCFYPNFRYTITVLILGIYFIALGITYILDCIQMFKGNMFKHIKIPLPVFIAAFIPFRLNADINKMIKEDKKIKRIKNNENADIEILVHIKDNKYERYGHIDICIDNIVFSYGSYDSNKVKLKHLIGDGVLFKVDKTKYIDFCTSKENKSIIVYGIRLNNDDKNKIIEKLDNIRKDTYIWDVEKESKEGQYSNRLIKNTNAILYKFNKGKFKKYFTPTTNCVALVDDLIGTTGLDILSISGIISPGTYYDYFNREFKRKNSNIVSKEIYFNNTKNKENKNVDKK